MTDEKFLEFWGNFLLSAARGKKQAEDVGTWTRQYFKSMNQIMTASQKGFSDLNEFSVMFRKFYGLDKIPEQSPEYESRMKTSASDFQKSLNDYLGMMGMVSKAEHLALVRKYEKLKEKCADQEETVRHLRMLLDTKGTVQGETVRTLQDIMKDQTELFRNMVAGIGQQSGKENPPDKTDPNHQQIVLKENTKKGEKEDDRHKTCNQTDG
ncbi:MAG: hypothetical protein BWK80_14665 [Desulfobacteraceae bacterium IS3]|nr:MAG: hypothetical protein BWK80_14665 [Desulfobacteraceae bacterium IS3]